MPNSLKCKIKHLCHNGTITERERDRILKALEQEPKTDTWSIKDVADTLAKHGLIAEQDPCEDAISRQAAKRAIEDRFIELQKRHDDKRYETNYCLNTILELPSVNPQEPKTGHWEMCEDADGIYGVCDMCGTDADFTHYGEAYPYCPNCGAKMVEQQESEE